MTKRFVVGSTALVAALVAWLPLAHAAPVSVRFTEGVMHGFPVLRSAQGERLASGELTQVARGDVVESRLVFRFQDGSLYDETVLFSQRGVFKIDKYRLVQRGPSFPESVEASIDRATGNYGEIFERNVGTQSRLSIPRGLNALWTKGGIQYAPPVR